MFAGLLHLQDLPCCDLLLSSLLPEHVATQICEIDDVRALSHVGAHDNPRTTLRRRNAPGSSRSPLELSGRAAKDLAFNDVPGFEKPWPLICTLGDEEGHTRQAVK